MKIEGLFSYILGLVSYILGLCDTFSYPFFSFKLFRTLFRTPGIKCQVGLFFSLVGLICLYSRPILTLDTLAHTSAFPLGSLVGLFCLYSRSLLTLLTLAHTSGMNMICILGLF